MGKDDRKHTTLRIPAALLIDIKAYAERHGTNVTQLTIEYYKTLIASETRQEADQI